MTGKTGHFQVESLVDLLGSEVSTSPSDNTARIKFQLNTRDHRFETESYASCKQLNSDELVWSRSINKTNKKQP